MTIKQKKQLILSQYETTNDIDLSYENICSKATFDNYIKTDKDFKNKTIMTKKKLKQLKKEWKAEKILIDYISSQLLSGITNGALTKIIDDSKLFAEDDEKTAVMFLIDHIKDDFYNLCNFTDLGKNSK